jgi:hypothetical protein
LRLECMAGFVGIRSPTELVIWAPRAPRSHLSVAYDR